ncbi:septum formation initiator family protein [Bacillus sp. B15-48]|uniref:FtsB family cell division protein n=1 Tax=Bacillus sp. B15-48 TaxID=1548601 RepID=UPI001940107F|nr:septum formation initiator family protein [Bacillus sp. B15-48]MBM4765302.1 septum formation initiator family protein [Bacillus sp. B15-48]
MSAIRKRTIAKLENEYIQQRKNEGIAKTRKQKRLYRRLAVFFVFAVFMTVIMLTTFISQTAALEEKQQIMEEREQELAELQKRHAYLENEISKLNDEEYIAKLARRDYFLSQEGEIIFSLPEGK